MSLTQTESWGTRVGLILAMAGNAVGLGNFLRFPVQAVNNGGRGLHHPLPGVFPAHGHPLVVDRVEHGPVRWAQQ
jgi:NSS family neurotransmitter:Na+ symporter